MTGCHSTSGNDIESLQFVHKYGFDVSQEEWEDRSREGQMIAVLRNGVKVTRSYEAGQLHGITSYTFPDSPVVEKLQVYDQGILLKEVIHDLKGIPVREDVFEFDNRRITTCWNEQGAPLSIEEYEDEFLQEGSYFTPAHDLEAQVEVGFGTRVIRDRTGLVLHRDRIESGVMSERTSFHPNGQIHSISHYHDYQLHGEQIKYTASGRPLIKLSWNHGLLDGIKTVYRNGIKIAEIPYVGGQKHGVESHYDDLGTLTAELEWRNDKKHGTSRLYSEEGTETEWYYRGQAVNEQRYQILEGREHFIANFTTD